MFRCFLCYLLTHLLEEVSLELLVLEDRLDHQLRLLERLAQVRHHADPPDQLLHVRLQQVAARHVVVHVRAQRLVGAVARVLRVVIQVHDAPTANKLAWSPRATQRVSRRAGGRIRIRAARVVPPPAGVKRAPQVVCQDPADAETPSRVAFAAPLTVEVIDPDAAKDSQSSVEVAVTTSDGAQVQVTCVISDAFWEAANTDFSNPALQAGRFIGQVTLQLGGQDSVAVVPLTQDMPRNLIGRVRIAEEGEEEPQGATRNLVTRVLSLTGSDQIAARYGDQRRPAGQPDQLAATGRLVTSAALQVTDREYEKAQRAFNLARIKLGRNIDADIKSEGPLNKAVVRNYRTVQDRTSVE